MRDKRFIALAVLVYAALTTTGFAIAAAKSGSISAASATFNATTVSGYNQKTCTVKNGDTYVFTHGTYTGTSTSSDARLTGPVTIKATTMLDQTTGLGALVGSFKVDGAKTTGANGHVEGSISGGQVAGAVRGHVTGPGGEIFSGISGAFTTNGGFSGGTLGSESAVASGVVLMHGACVHSLDQLP